MTTQAEQTYLEAEADIRNSNYYEAFQKYESILYDEPGFAPAHNSLGWIFRTQFDNYEKAEMHLKAAIQADPLYPHPYFHLAGLYIDLEKFDELKSLLDKSLTIVTIDKAWVYYRFGMMQEIQSQYELAIAFYKKAIINSISNDKIKDYQADIERCTTKQSILQEQNTEKEKS
jgi:tetratricopeptide (TPR) repeat protein